MPSRGRIGESHVAYCGAEGGQSGGSRITVRSLTPADGLIGKALTAASPAIDRLLALTQVDALYRRAGGQGLSPSGFSARLLAELGVSVVTTPSRVEDRVAQKGPLLVVCNHPFGGIEALVLLTLLTGLRQDVKILANSGLTVIPELRPILIPTNPLKISGTNASSIRLCKIHLRDGGLLILFPAGRVSSYQDGSDVVTDAPWHRLVGHLVRHSDAELLPVFIAGKNSRMFLAAGRIWDRAKLLLLPRELLKFKDRPVRVALGHPVPTGAWRGMNDRSITETARTLTYLQGDLAHSGPPEPPPPPATIAISMPIAPRGHTHWMEREVTKLAAHNVLLNYKQYSVCYARAIAIPSVMAEIARERERVFRDLDEGSGRPRDCDHYDNTYLQLFVWDHGTSTLVGAYRLGQTDKLFRTGRSDALYLSQMFDFDPAFYSGAGALELGRSFVVPEHQNTFHGLYLLWRGIGSYLLRHPRYRRLYGTVSLPKTYSAAATRAICEALIEPSQDVRPRFPLLPAIEERGCHGSRIRSRNVHLLGGLVRALDREGKDLPVLLKHYLQLGARFHAVGVDPNFNATPGLLLSVDIPSLHPKALKTFLGPEYQGYLRFDPTSNETPRPNAKKRAGEPAAAT